MLVVIRDDSVFNDLGSSLDLSVSETNVKGF